MHIQRGDERGYIEKQAEADFSGAYAGIANNALNQGVSVMQNAFKSTMANNQIDLSAKFLSINNDINTKYQADPTNPQREIESKQAFDKLASEYKINPVCEVQWNEIKNNVYNRYKTYNSQWSEKQQQSNISTNLENGYKSLNDQISMLGLNGASIDEVRLVYDNGIQGLKEGAEAKLGTVFVENALRESDHDLMTTYISALALNNPLEAQRLLQDEGVRNDIGRAETIEKLEAYTANSLSNQNKRVAVNELGNTLRNMNSAEADDIINGQADLTKVMKFIESNKNLPEGSKDLVLGIYGIGSKTDYYYDRDKKKIVKQPEGGTSNGGLVSLSKLSQIQKDSIAADLEAELYDMFSFDDTQEVKPKKAVKKGEAQDIQSNVLDRMKSISLAQGKIDTMYQAKVIDKPTRRRLMNQFIEPMANYLEANMQGLDEKSHFMGPNLGYGALKKEFSIDNIPANQTNKIRAIQSSLLTAQGYYYNALDEARQKNGLKSIYDIETLPAEKQRMIYSEASKGAINMAKKYGKYPEVFFQKEYPETYNLPFQMFKQNQANDIAKAVAKSIYQSDVADKDKDEFVNKAMALEMKQQNYKNRMEASKVLGTLPDNYQALSNPDPKNYIELQKELKDLGFSVKDFHNFAIKNGYVNGGSYNFPKGGYMSKDYMRAFRDIKHLNAMYKKDER